jgi:hypothetical protein
MKREHMVANYRNRLADAARVHQEAKAGSPYLAQAVATIRLEAMLWLMVSEICGRLDALLEEVPELEDPPPDLPKIC